MKVKSKYDTEKKEFYFEYKFKIKTTKSITPDKLLSVYTAAEQLLNSDWSIDEISIEFLIYVYGNGYKFNKETGKFSRNGVYFTGDELYLKFIK
jgi:hypothetical protein